ncbi:MAG: hypothetical protein ACRC8U_03860, partial [Brooklawnia sp.]
MATQNIDFTTPTDSGEDASDAIRPILNGDAGNATTFNRPSEALRVRTETLRKALEDLRYLTDADRSLLLTCAKGIIWNGVVQYENEQPLGDTGIFSIDGIADDTLTVRPFVTPAVSTPARGTIDNIVFSTYLVMPAPYEGVAPPRAYSGANNISV